MGYLFCRTAKQKIKMSYQNRLLEALSDDQGVSRKELKEAISELSASQRKRNIQKHLNANISSQIFKFLIGLVVLIALLVMMFIAGNRYLFYNQALEGFVSKNYSKSGAYFSNLFSLDPLKKPANNSISTPQMPVKKQGQNYYIQLAICRYDKCSNEYIGKASSLGLPYQVVTLEVGEKIIFKEIVSAKTMDLQRAQNLAEFINTVNDRSGYANIIPAPDGLFYISLGSFPNADIAEDLRRYYESLTAAESVEFAYKDFFTASSSGLSKILVGPFSDEQKVKSTFQEVVKVKGLQTAFITVK